MSAGFGGSGREPPNKAELPETAIVILSSNADKHFVEEARKIGTRAYVARSKAAEALVTAIERAISTVSLF